MWRRVHTVSFLVVYRLNLALYICSIKAHGFKLLSHQKLILLLKAYTAIRGNLSHSSNIRIVFYICVAIIYL